MPSNRSGNRREYHIQRAKSKEKPPESMAVWKGKFIALISVFVFVLRF